jgi:hypothetical protein
MTAIAEIKLMKIKHFSEDLTAHRLIGATYLQKKPGSELTVGQFDSNLRFTNHSAENERDFVGKSGCSGRKVVLKTTNADSPIPGPELEVCCCITLYTIKLKQCLLKTEGIASFPFFDFCYKLGYFQ